MSTTLSIQNLIQHFQDKIRQIDRNNMGDVVGKEPQFPQLVVYLGSDAAKAHQAVSSNLFQTWPQYQFELKFLGVEKSGAGLTYTEHTAEGDQPVSISEEGVQEMVSALFGTKMHFRDRSRLLVYYILDTTSFTGRADFLSWMPVINALKKLLCADATDLMDMLVLLLNENHSRQKIAAQVRDSLGGFYSKNEVREAVSNVLLLSNRRSDKAILEDWNICYQILSAVIALSNNSDTQVTTSIFCNSVLTASYAREEKPIAQIGQVVVQNLLNQLADTIPQTDPKLLEEPDLPEKLGMTKQGTFSLLDAYAENSLYGLLPTEDQLEFFPRRDCSFQMYMSSMSARNFDDYTMGAWNQCLSEIAKTAQKKVAMNSAIRQSWSNEYRKLLISAFSKEEILYLVGHINDVTELMTRTREPSQESVVLEAAKDQLKYMLSSDETLVRVFVDALLEQGRYAEEFTQAWNNLLKSRRWIHDVRDSNISSFYERKVRNYCDRHGSEMCTTFTGMHDTVQLERFLQLALERIIDSDEIFSAAFEDELENRLNEDAQSADARQYIRKKLTGNDVYTYLQTNFALGEPVVSAILIKIGTRLYDNLHNNLSPTTYYYNTGCGNAAEALVIYEVSAVNLVNGEE